MTDARFPDRWLSDRRLQRLSDSHFRAFITSLVWSVSNRTDGVIEPEDLGLIPNFAPNSVKAFLDAELWSPLVKGWQIKDYATTQTSREQLSAAEAARAREREKKARQRAAKKATTTSANPDVPGDIPGDSRGDNTGQDRTGQDTARRSKPKESPALAAVVNGPPQWRGSGPSPFDEYK
ncbi:hypothetical protein [Mycolicibacterium austroafricanum]|uniref:hypothetical protein n=1 Tax=Mycolicibacterium austroafricanum TaxID=39687 RepID=UPI000CFA5336|nr:hypothetical protein [Mycolicibacterium austroafricanum]PQP38797.1 hypothetical protein C6A88_34855 [Mycolicibacterium austroafricanum]